MAQNVCASCQAHADALAFTAALSDAEEFTSRDRSASPSTPGSLNDAMGEYYKKQYNTKRGSSRNASSSMNDAMGEYYKKQYNTKRGSSGNVSSSMNDAMGEYYKKQYNTKRGSSGNASSSLNDAMGEYYRKKHDAQQVAADSPDSISADSIADRLKRVARRAVDYAKSKAGNAVVALDALYKQATEAIEELENDFDFNDKGEAHATVLATFIKYTRKLLKLGVTVQAALAAMTLTKRFLTKIITAIQSGDYTKLAYESSKLTFTYGIAKLCRKAALVVTENTGSQNIYDPVRESLVSTILDTLELIMPKLQGTGVADGIARGTARVVMPGAWAALMLSREGDVDALFEKGFGDLVATTLGLLGATVAEKEQRKRIEKQQGALDKISRLIELR